jgi:hypothetical protein
MEVILRPLRRTGWAGDLFKYKNCSDRIGTYWTRSGNFYTGFEEIENGDLKRKELEEKLGKSLSPSSEFWNEFYIIIGNKDIFLRTEDPMDELKYIFLKNHKRVKNGFSDSKPTAHYVIINKESEAQEANKFNQIKRKAIREFDKLSAVQKQKALRLYGHKSDNISAELIENKLFDLVEREPAKFLSLWVDNDKRETEFLLQEAVAKNVIRRNKSEYKYGTDTIGHTKDDAVQYLDSPENRDLKAIITGEVNSK